MGVTVSVGVEVGVPVAEGDGLGVDVVVGEDVWVALGSGVLLAEGESLGGKEVGAGRVGAGETGAQDTVSIREKSRGRSRVIIFIKSSLW